MLTSLFLLSGYSGASSMPYFPPVVVGNVTHDLAHLEPVMFATPSAKLGRPIRTRCKFTTHTFTAKAPDGHSGPILIDEGGRPRVFCPDRYTLSRQLPSVIRLLADPDRYVREGARERNWLHSAEVVLSDTAEDAALYQVFFKLDQAERRLGYDVEMVVESAYAFDPLRAPKTVGRMKIVNLLVGAVEGRKLHTQRRPDSTRAPQGRPK